MENKFGSNLRILRKRQKLTLETLGEKLKISKSALSDYEIGKTFPPLDVCDLLSDFFQLNIDDLKNADLAKFSEIELFDFLKSKKKQDKFNEETIGDFSEENKQLQFSNKLLKQQIEGLQVQLQLVKQLLVSKDSEIKSLQIQVRLLEEKLANFISYAEQ